MFGVIIAVHVLVSLFLIFVILLQPGRADGMAALGGGGSASSVFGGRGSVTFLAKDGKKDEKAPSISAARWTVQRALNGQEVELQIECKNPKGSLEVEIWAQSADPSQDKSVKKLDVQAGATVKQKVKLQIPADAAGGNECHFYFVVKDESGASRKSEPLFVDRAPFKFST